MFVLASRVRLRFFESVPMGEKLRHVGYRRMGTTTRTFNELRGGGDDCYTTLAYWLGPWAGTLTSEAALEVAAAMSFQYDFEEQADAYGAALPADQNWTRAFAPVAPVQLAHEWSPLPCAVEVLGQPAVEALEVDAGIRMAVAAWDASTVSGVKSTARHSSNADEKRFLGLLTVSVARAKEDRRGLLVIAKPGWSYDHVHGITKKTARLMGKAGFVVTTRRP